MENLSAGYPTALRWGGRRWFSQRGKTWRKGGFFQCKGSTAWQIYSAIKLKARRLWRGCVTLSAARNPSFRLFHPILSWQSRSFPCQHLDIPFDFFCVSSFHAIMCTQKPGDPSMKTTCSLSSCLKLLLLHKLLLIPTQPPRGTASLPHLRSILPPKVLTINAYPCVTMMMINTFPYLFSYSPFRLL